MQDYNCFSGERAKALTCITMMKKEKLFKKGIKAYDESCINDKNYEYEE